MRTEIDVFTTKLDGLQVEIASEDVTVVIRAGALAFRLTPGETERFAKAFVAACWVSGRNETNG